MRRIDLGWMMAVTLVAAACAPAKEAGGGSASAAGGGGNGKWAEQARKIDSIVNAPIKAGKVVGGSIAVIKGKDTIDVKAFGKANAELDVPTPPHAVYEIGSVTKQFTAAALLQLVEQGKVNLDDDISKYLPDYNAQGRKIPVRRLLDHTSGIKGYTEIPEFRTLIPLKLPRDTLVKIFSKKPFDFEPGEEQIYNNSAFFLAGMIIAKVSGMSYEDYVEKNLFAKAGMNDSHYCSESKIIKNKVEGYDTDSTGPINKGALSHQWPYAAGSLCSSAVDLVRWNEALHREGKIIGAAAYKEMITPGKLNDGTVVGYGKGIAVYPRDGHKALHHGGGINGFLSENIYFPDDSLSVVVLFNTAGPGSPDEVAESIAEVVLGKKEEAGKPIDGDVNRFAGTYAGRGRGRPAEFVFAVDNGKLTMKGQRDDSAHVLTYLGNNTFARNDLHLIFLDSGGKIAKVRVDGGYGNNLLAKKS